MAYVEPREPSAAEDGRREYVLGLIASPGFCERVANGMVDELCEYLRSEIDQDADWRVEVVTDPLTGSNVDLGRVVDKVASWMKSRTSWEFAISLTDLPVRIDDRIIIARASPTQDVGVVSVPPLGPIRIHDHTRAMVLQIMQHLMHDTTQELGAWRKIGPETAQQVESPQVEGDVEYSAPGRRAHLKLLAGMVYANRPWSLFPSFKTTVATAFATGGYGLIFTTLWEIGNVYGLARLITLMLVAMTILVVWIIVSHGLWEPRQDDVKPYLWSLYNTTTLLTVAAGVVFSYVLIFLLLLGAATIYIPTSMLKDTIGHEVTPVSYMRIAWVTSSVATIAGAIGAGLEDTDAVRNATFGWRQQNRWQQYNEQQEEEEERSENGET